MSHTTSFIPPKGWARAVLIHDGHGMPGTVELRAWYPKNSGRGKIVAYLDGEPDLVMLLHQNGHLETKMSSSAPIPQQSMFLEQQLLYCAGLAVGAARLKAKINTVLDQ